MTIQDHVFIVMGAASSLGAATAKLLVDNGGFALLVDINSEAGAAMKTALGVRAKFIQTDVTDEASVQNAIDAALAQFGGLHGAINCAGTGPAERVVGKNGPHLFASFTRTYHSVSRFRFHRDWASLLNLRHWLNTLSKIKYSTAKQSGSMELFG